MDVKTRPLFSAETPQSSRVLTLWRIDLNEVLQFAGVTGDRAAAVGLHVRVDAPVAEDEARRRQDGGVCAEAAAQRAGPVVVSGPCRRLGAALVLLQVERGWGDGRGREGFDGVLVVRRVPPFQELQKEDAQGEGGGERHGQTPGCL